MRSTLPTIPLNGSKRMSLRYCVQGLRYKSWNPIDPIKFFEKVLMATDSIPENQRGWELLVLYTVLWENWLRESTPKFQKCCMWPYRKNQHIHRDPEEYMPGWCKDDIINYSRYECGVHGSSSSARHWYIHLPQMEKGTQVAEIHLHK